MGGSPYLCLCFISVFCVKKRPKKKKRWIQGTFTCESPKYASPVFKNIRHIAFQGFRCLYPVPEEALPLLRASLSSHKSWSQNIRSPSSWNPHSQIFPLPIASPSSETLGSRGIFLKLSLTGSHWLVPTDSAFYMGIASHWILLNIPSHIFGQAK